MGLRPTHLGYAYQDLFTAIRLVDVALGLASTVTVDTKLYDKDRFDDLTTEWLTGKRDRLQIKHSEREKDLAKSTFTADKRDLRLDVLVRAISVDAVGHPGTEYRILLRDDLPQDRAQAYRTERRSRSCPAPAEQHPTAVRLWRSVYHRALGEQAPGSRRHGGATDVRLADRRSRHSGFLVGPPAARPCRAGAPATRHRGVGRGSTSEPASRS